MELQQREQNSVLNFYKKMIALKKANEIFTYCRYDLLLKDDPQIYAYTRTLDGEQVIVMFNLSDRSVDVKKDLGFSYQYQQLLLNNYPVMEHPPLSELKLNPFETRVYRV